jgi:hypothetical protein
MTRPAPALLGFRAIFHRPSLGLAEIAWRWSFGTAASLLLLFSFFEYLNTLPVSNSDLLLLRTTEPVLISRALLHIFRGSGFRAAQAAVLLALTLGMAWVVVASLARAATVKAALAYFRESGIASLEHAQEGNWRLRSLFALNFFRLAATLAAIVGVVAAILLGGAASSPADPAPGRALLIIFTVVLLVGLAWSTLNWFLSLATILAVANRQDTFGAITAAIDLCQTRAGSVFAAGTWFGLAHLTAFVVAGSVVAFPLGFAAVLPAGVVLGGVLTVAMLYFVIVDFLHVGRMSAYLAIVEMPGALVSAENAPPPLPHGGTSLKPSAQSSSAIDANELILSDVPASS